MSFIIVKLHPNEVVFMSAFKLSNCLLFISFFALFSSSASALTTTQCQEALDELKNLCLNNINLPGNKSAAAINKIKSSCFCGPTQSNNGGNSNTAYCSKTNQQSTMNFSTSPKVGISTERCTTINASSSTNSFSNYSGYCSVTGSHKDLTTGTKLMHKLDSSFVNDREILQRMERGCQNVIQVHDTYGVSTRKGTEKSPYFLFNTNAMDLTKLDNPNDVIFMAKNAGLQLVYDNIMEFSMSGNILSADTVRINIYNHIILNKRYFNGAINAYQFDFNVDPDLTFNITRDNGNKTCADCTLKDESENSKYRVILTQETACSPVKISVQECNSSDTCVAATTNVEVNIRKEGNGTTTTDTDTIPPAGKLLSIAGLSKISVAPKTGNYTCGGGANPETNGCPITLKGCNAAVAGEVAYVNQVAPFIINLTEAIDQTESSGVPNTKYQAQITFDMDNATEFDIRDLANANKVSTINRANNTVTVSLVNLAPKGSTYSSLAPQFAILDLVTPLDELKINKLSVIATNANNESEITNIKNVNLPISTIPLAFCLKLDNQNIDSNLLAGKYYTYASKAVGCMDEDTEICARLPLQKIETLTQSELKDICADGYEITNKNALNNYDTKKLINEKLLAIAPNYLNNWKQSPALDATNYYLVECKYDNSLEATLCQSDILAKDYNDKDQTFTYGYTSASFDKVAISDIGWFSFSQTEPTLIGGTAGNKTFYYSPIYSVLPTSLATADNNGYLNADYNLDIAEITDRYTSLKFPTEININHKIVDGSCPAYYDEHLALTGFVSAVDVNDKLVHNVVKEYITQTDIGDGLSLAFYTINPIEPTRLNEFTSIDTPKLSKTHTLGNGFAFYTDYKINRPNDLSAKRLYLTYDAQMQFLTTNGKKRITSLNNVCNTLIDKTDEGNLASCKQGVIDRADATEQRLYVLPTVSGLNPLTFTKSRIVSQMITGNANDIFVPITIQAYDINQKGWKIQTNDSCTSLVLYDANKILEPTLRFLNSSGNNPNVASNGQLDLSNIATHRTTLSLCQDAENTNCKLVNKFNKGTILLKAQKPSVIDNNKSYANFSVISLDPVLADTDSLSKPINNLTHLVDFNTSRGGFMFREVKANTRIIHSEEIFDTSR